MTTRIVLFLALVLTLVRVPRADAIMVAGDQPPASLVAPVLPWTGDWHGFVGTPVGPTQFLTAAHVGGGIGDVFELGGLQFRATAVAVKSDLALWTVDTAFATWAPLDLELRGGFFDVLMVGRGTLRGPEVVGSDGSLLGYVWGGPAPGLSWGLNRGIISFRSIQTEFNAGFDFEGQATGGDSGGQTWTLTPDGPRLSGIISAASRTIVDGRTASLFGGSTISESLAHHSDWLKANLVPIPEPHPTVLLLAGLVLLHGILFLRR